MSCGSNKTTRRPLLFGSVRILVVRILAIATAITFLVVGRPEVGGTAQPRPEPMSQVALTSSSDSTIHVTASLPPQHLSLNASGVSVSGRAFTYGYDFSDAMTTAVWPSAEHQAAKIAATMPGSFEDVAIMGWGPGNPEVSPGIYKFTGIANQLSFVKATGGIPIITLCGAPDWMKGGQVGATDWTQLGLPPQPQHFQDFANLSAAVAQAFPDVKYFNVWSELRGFWSSTTHSWDAASYTTLYNDVYQAVKAVRPDAAVGGPYVSIHSEAGPAPVRIPTPSGPWGHLDAKSLAPVSFWITHNVGADFIAVDGRAFTQDAGLTTDPLTSTQKYAAMDQWLTSQTHLPIVWMESHLLPDTTGYSDQQQASIRVGALLQMASSGASLGMQWNPEQLAGWDEGLWTTAQILNGGQPTVLAQELPAVLNVLAAPVTIVPGTPAGTLVATGANGTVTVTYSATAATVTVTNPGA